MPTTSPTTPTTPRKVPVAERREAWFGLLSDAVALTVAELQRDAGRPSQFSSNENWIKDRVRHWHDFLWTLGIAEE